MKKLVVYIILCTILFSAGMGMSIVLDTAKPVRTKESETESGMAPADLSDVVPGNPDADLIPANPTDAIQLPVPVHGKSLSPEELFRFGAMYKQQQEALAERNQEIERRQARLKLLRDDLAGSRKEFDGLREQVQDASARAAKMIQELNAQRELLQREKQEAEEQLKQVETQNDETTALEGGNIRRISSWFQGMPPEKAAEYIREICNDGNIDSAVKLLGVIEERNAAKILASMEDPSLVVEIMEAFKHYKREQDAKR